MKVKIGMFLLVLISGSLYYSLSVNASGYLSDSVEISIGQAEPLREEVNTTQRQVEVEIISTIDSYDYTKETLSQTESTETSEIENDELDKLPEVPDVEPNESIEVEAE